MNDQHTLTHDTIRCPYISHLESLKYFLESLVKICVAEHRRWR